MPAYDRGAAGRRRPAMRLGVALLLGFSLAACAGGAAEETAPAASATDAAAPAARTPDATAPAAGAPAFSVLVFSRTAGFRHDSIAAGRRAIEELGRTHGFAVVASEDAALFSDAALAGYQAVVFLNTSGDILNPEQQGAFERFIRAGGGFVGVHAASDTEYGWPWYGELVGAYFADHPEIQRATVVITDRSHPATAGLPESWTREDEWYNFRSQPAAGARILAQLDEASYAGGTMGASHPVIWCREVAGGRSWYTALGHTSASYDEPLFRAHLLGGIQWAAGKP